MLACLVLASAFAARVAGAHALEASVSSLDEAAWEQLVVVLERELPGAGALQRNLLRHRGKETAVSVCVEPPAPRPAAAARFVAALRRVGATVGDLRVIPTCEPDPRAVVVHFGERVPFAELQGPRVAVTSAFVVRTVPFTTAPAVSADCLEYAEAPDLDAIRSLYTGAGLPVSGLERAASCFRGPRTTVSLPPAPGWGEVGGTDFVALPADAGGELAAWRSRNVATLFAFGGPWCGPCMAGATWVGELLREGAPLAVRAAWYPDPWVAKAAPLVTANLDEVAFPTYVVLSPAGDTRYRGSSIEEALATLGLHDGQGR